MPHPPLEELLARLERERIEADRRYNDALTAVNLAIQRVPTLPVAPPLYDPSHLERLNGLWRIGAAAPTAVAAGWRGRLRDAVWRLIGPSLEQQQEFNAALVEHLNRNAASMHAVPEVTADVIAVLQQALTGLYRFQSLLVQCLMTITAFVDTRDRQLGAEEVIEQVRSIEQRLVVLGRDLDRLRQAGAVAPPGSVGMEPSVETLAPQAASLAYVGFEDRFRGSVEEIRARVEDYVPILSSGSDVVDIGCGRGELLEALKQHGIRARGVDANHAMVELCRARHLEVEESDAVAFLQRQAPGSLGGLVAIQVVEHFTPAQLGAFLQAAHECLRPGAPLVLETINPACWSAFFETYIRDLTHQRPLHPETLKYVVQSSGFVQVDIQFRQPVRETDRLSRVQIPPTDAPSAWHDAVSALNDHADKLNARLFSSFDYVVLARR